MSKLKEMQDSCAVFATDLKTGNIKWEKSDSFYTSWQYSYHNKTNVGLIRLWLNNDMQENHGFWYRLNDNNNIKLKSTTAKEAAAEALQLVKQEAQKLVDALSVEIKETHSEENNSWFYVRKTLGQVKDSLQAFTKKLQHLTDSVSANHFRDLEKAIIAVDKMGLELKKYNALSEPKEPFWTKIDPENYPLIEVFCINDNEQALGGQIVKNSKGVLSCVSEYDSISNPTHYCTYEQIIKLLPRPQ